MYGGGKGEGLPQRCRERRETQRQLLPGSMKLNRPLQIQRRLQKRAQPFDPALRGLRMNRPAGRFTSSAPTSAKLIQRLRAGGTPALQHQLRRFAVQSFLYL